MKNLTLKEFLIKAETEKNICLFKKIQNDLFTPIQIYSALMHKLPNGTILESGVNQTAQGKYTHLGFSPLAELVVQNKQTILTKKNEKQILNISPFDAARLLLTEYHCNDVPEAIKFIGGGVGYLNYDAIRLFESIPSHPLDESDAIDFLFTIYRLNITFDHTNHTLYLATQVRTSGEPEKSYQEACNELDEIQKIIQNATSPPKTKAVKPSPIKANINDQQFIALIEKAKEHIVAGDVFQIVLSRKFFQHIHVHPFDVYRALRLNYPAPYMFYFDRGDVVIFGASPEKLVSLDDRKICIMPIAGTRSRHIKNDQTLIDELLVDEKELAEHIMLVDLARNDIGSVSAPGSVKVIEFAQAKIFSHLIHLVSIVTGILDTQFDAFDLLQKAFPAGTVSGAPKIRAMELINQLETSPRGFYGGCVFYIDHLKNLESCLAIRMAVVSNQQVEIQTGAGIVYDSESQKEAQETRDKAKSILDAIACAEQGDLS